MSVRAYRVKKIDYELPNTFNLWHDDKLAEFLDRDCGFYETLNEGTGLTDVPIETLERALVEVRMDDDLKQAIQKDIDACKADGYVTYYCF